MKSLFCSVALSLCLFSGVAVAQEAKEQAASVKQERRHKMHTMRERWEKLGPAERARLRQRLQQFKNMTPQERAELRERMQKIREHGLNDDMRARLHRLKQLSPEQRQRLKKYLKHRGMQHKQRAKANQQAQEN